MWENLPASRADAYLINPFEVLYLIYAHFLLLPLASSRTIPGKRVILVHLETRTPFPTHAFRIRLYTLSPRIVLIYQRVLRVYIDHTLVPCCVSYFGHISWFTESCWSLAFGEHDI